MCEYCDKNYTYKRVCTKLIKWNKSIKPGYVRSILALRVLELLDKYKLI